MSTEAQIVISAVDKTSAVLKNIGDGVGQVTGQFSALGTAVSGFAALAGVTAFTGMIAGSIEAADSLNDLSKKTGLAVETLSGVALAAKQSGTDLDGVAQSINKLGINIAKDTEKFAKLGITAKEPLEAFKQLADVVSKIEDPQKRAAVAAEALGKSWQSSMPLLAEGSQKIQEMVDKGKKLSGVTTELSEQSDQFNDQMAELRTSFGGVANSITLKMLPTLNSLSKEFALGMKNADGFFDAMQKYGLTNPFESYEAKLAGLKREFEQVDYRLSNERAKTGDEALSRSLQQQIDYYTALTEKKVAATQATVGMTAAEKAAADAFIKSETDKKAAATASAEAQFNLWLAEKKGEATAETTARQKAAAAAAAEYAKNVEALISPLEKQAYELERQVEVYGQTESAIQSTIVARLEEARALAKDNGAWDDHLEFLDREIEARKRIGTAASQKEFLDTNKAAAENSAKEWEKFSDDINRSLTDSLFRAFESGESFGKSFAKSLEATFKTMVLKFAVNYVMNGSGQLIGGLGNSALNSILGTGASNSGSGINYMGVANNLSTANSLYGALTGLSGYQVGASSASLLYANGVGMVGGDSLGALIAANGSWSGVGTGAAAGTGAATGSTAGGTAGSSGSAAGVSSVAWIAAIVAGMWMSSEAWKAGIRWENYAKSQDVAAWDAEVGIRAAHDEPARAIFGDNFVDSQFYAIMGGGSLSAQIHYGIQSALFGAERVTGTQTTGTFSEAAQGFTGQYGVNMKKTGGLFSGSREWTDWHALPKQVDTIMDTLYRGVRNSFVMLGETFDDTTIADKLEGFKYRFNVASTDMATIANSASANLQKAMGDILTPSITELKKKGEKWTAAFERVLVEADAVTRVLDLMGDSMSGTFGTNNLDGILKASDAFIGLFGTVDKFNASFGAYYGNFYTQQEQFNQAWQDMQVQFTSIGQTMPTTRQGFRDLVDSLDLSTESGRKTFASLMSLQAAFSTLTPSLEDAAYAASALSKANLETQAQQIGKVLEAQRKAEADAVRNDIATVQATATTAATLIESFTQISASLGTYRNSLATSGQSPTAQYSESKRLYEATATAARLGDTSAAGKLQGDADAFLQAALATGTAGSYARDVANVASTVDAVIGLADRQIPIAQSQLDVANQQLVTLNALLATVTGSQGAIVVSNYAQAATDWATFFASTSIGGVMQTAAGTMQRLSDTVGMFIDNNGMGYTFSATDSPYALASISDAWRQEMLTRYGQWQVPAFASGGYHAGGLRLVGENGPELEMTGPSSIINASDTAALLSGGSGMAAALRALLREVAALRAEQRDGDLANVNVSSRMARLLEKFDIDGMPEVRAA